MAFHNDDTECFKYTVKYFTSKSKVTFARLAVAQVLTPFPKSRICADFGTVNVLVP